MISPIYSNYYYSPYSRIETPIWNYSNSFDTTFMGNNCGDKFKSTKPATKLSETQQWGIVTLVAVGLAVIGDFVFAKGKHVKSILGMAEKESGNIKPKTSTHNSSNPNSAPKPPETPDVKSPESTQKPLQNNSEQITEEPVIPQEVPNNHVSQEHITIESPIKNERQIPVEQPKPQPTENEIPKPDNGQKNTDKIRTKWKQQQKQRFDSVKDKVSGKIQTQVKDKNNNVVNAEISAQQGMYSDYRREISVNGKVVGASENLIHPDCEFVANLPENYQYGQSALEIKYLGTTSDYKGSGAELIKAAIQDSKNAGYEGRVFVNACGGSLPPDFGFIGAGKYGTSPVPFYYKQGFRFYDESLNQQVLLGLKELAKTGVYPKTAPQSGIMHLPY